MSKFSGIVLSQTFRPLVLKDLRGHSGWDDYRKKNGLASNGLTSAQIYAACEALGYDLAAASVAFHASTSSTSNTPALDAKTLAWQPVEDVEDVEAPAFQYANQGDESMGEAGANNAAGAAAINAAAGAYEGKAPEDVLDGVLAPVEGHLTPYVQGLLPGLLRPLVEAAIQGPRTITQTIVQGPPPAPGSWTPPAVNVKAWQGVRQAFGLRKSEGTPAVNRTLDNARVPLCDYAGAPAIDPDYVWDTEVLGELVAHDIGGLNVWLHGPAGTGKTEGAKQYAARLGRPFVRIAIERTTEPADIIGQEVLAKDGGMEWHDGKLTRAFRTPYCVILIDEITLLRSGSLAIFQTALDGARSLFLSTGEVVTAAQGVFVIAADNTAGVGDDSGRYVDTAAVNVALSDRFAGKVGFDYLPPAREAGMIAARSGLPKDACRLMTNYAGLTRSKANAGQLTIGVTPRRLLGWASLVKAGIGSQRAFNSCVISGCAPEDREALLMMETSSLKSDHATIDQMAAGTYQAPAPASTPLDVEPSNRRDNPKLAGAYPDDEAL